MRWDVGIELGTETVRMAEYKTGVVIDMPSAMAFRDGRDTPIYVGETAAQIRGRVCEGVSVVYPMRDGVPENNLYPDRMFRWLYRHLNTVNPKRRFNVLLTCAPFSRPVHREALLTAAIDAGAASAMLVRCDTAAAVGADLEFGSPEAKLLLDIGAGKISATLFTMGRIAAYDYLPYGMNRIDQRVARILRTEYGWRVGIDSAREIKHTLGTALPKMAPKDVIMHMTGFSIADRLPRAFDVETKPVLDACEDVVSEIVRLCASVVDNAPEELSADLNDTGITVVGGGAEIANLDKRLGDALSMPCRIADAPANCGIRGLYKIMQDPDRYANAFYDRKESPGWR